MKPYQFKLEKLLKVKEFVEREWQMKFARVQGEYIRLKNDILDMENRINHFCRQEQEKELIKLQTGKKSAVFDYLMREDYLHGIYQNIGRTTKQKNDMLPELENLRKKLMEKTKEKKVLEKLKQRQQEQFKKYWQKIQQIEVDDIVMSKKIRDKISHDFNN